MLALDMFSCQNEDESELKNFEVSGWRIKSEGRGTRTIQYPITET
jgi:hypothetical protein